VASFISPLVSAIGTHRAWVLVGLVLAEFSSTPALP